MNSNFHKPFIGFWQSRKAGLNDIPHDLSSVTLLSDSVNNLLMDVMQQLSHETAEVGLLSMARCLTYLFDDASK